MFPEPEISENCESPQLAGYLAKQSASVVLIAGGSACM